VDVKGILPVNIALKFGNRKKADATMENAEQNKNARESAWCLLTVFGTMLQTAKLLI
jgi:hypothetical protein